jgi:hypothetical protein
LREAGLVKPVDAGEGEACGIAIAAVFRRADQRAVVSE